jgi:hypothetical protein
MADERPRIAHPWIDESRAPLYVWSFPATLDDDELARCCEARERWAEVARFPVAWIVDLENLGGATARQRKLFGDHLARFEPHDVAWNQGSAIVAKNQIVRGLVTAVFWLQVPKFPHQVFATRTEAAVWAKARLAEAAARAKGGAPDILR